MSVSIQRQISVEPFMTHLGSPPADLGSDRCLRAKLDGALDCAGGLSLL